MNTSTSIWRHPLVLWASSLLISIALWHSISDHHHTTSTYVVPLHIYNAAHDTIRQSLPTMTVTLQGKRQDLRRLDTSTLAVYIDAQKWQKRSSYRITSNDLFLPPSIKLISYTPSNPTIIIENSKQHEHL